MEKENSDINKTNDDIYKEYRKFQKKKDNYILIYGKERLQLVICIIIKFYKTR